MGYRHMNKLMLSLITVSVLAANSAFAKNLGQLSEDRIPQNLVQASEFLEVMKNPAAHITSREQDRVRLRGNASHSRYWWGSYYGGLGYMGYGYYYPYYYGAYYYPYYSYGWYPSYYGYGWAKEPGNSTGMHETSDVSSVGNESFAREASRNAIEARIDAAHTPVVCFAADESGQYYAEAREAIDVLSAQDAANRECAGSQGHCVKQNLGCAVAFGDVNK